MVRRDIRTYKPKLPKRDENIIVQGLEEIGIGCSVYSVSKKCDISRSTLRGRIKINRPGYP